VSTLSFSFSHQDTFSLSFSLVDKNLLNFSFSTFSFSHSSITPKWTQSYQTVNDITKYRVRRNHTVRRAVGWARAFSR